MTTASLGFRAHLDEICKGSGGIVTMSSQRCACEETSTQSAVSLSDLANDSLGAVTEKRASSALRSKKPCTEANGRSHPPRPFAAPQVNRPHAGKSRHK